MGVIEADLFPKRQLEVRTITSAPRALASVDSRNKSKVLTILNARQNQTQT
jgi:hypothetical protein